MTTPSPDPLSAGERASPDRGRESNTENFIQDFGPASPMFRFASSSWLEAIGSLRNQGDFQATYRRWRKTLCVAHGTSVGNEALFVRHTYLATLAKLIAYLRISGAGTPPGEAQTKAILRGSFFEEQQIVNLLEDDSSQWVASLPVVTCTQKIASCFAALLFTYRLRELSEDVLKDLYQALVDPKDRHGLGEHYTPDWLAARMCDALLGESGNETVLDPACGSGAFLFQAILHKKRRLAASRESLDTILGSVAGMDVHPLAVLVSKVNVLLALGDLLGLRSGPVSIPVYLANSIRPEFSTKAFAPLGGKVDRPGIVFSPGGPDEGIGTLPNGGNALGVPTLPSMLNRFDVVIGNPPWLSFRFIEKGEYQNYLKDLIVKEFGLLEGSAHLITHLELATLFFARCANLYLKPSGRIGFVLPRSIFTADQHDRFRRSCGMGNATLTRIWDLEGVSPLFRVPAAVAFGDLSGHIDKTLPGEILHGRLKRRNASREEAAGELKSEAAEFRVVQQGWRSFLSSRSCPPAEGRQESMKMREAPWSAAAMQSPWNPRQKAVAGATALQGASGARGSSADPRFWGPRFFHGDRDKPRTPTRGVRATRHVDFQSTESSEVFSRRSYYQAHFREGATIVPRSFWFVEIKPAPAPGALMKSGHRVVATDPRARVEAKPPYKRVNFQGAIEDEFIYATLLSTDLLPFGHLDFRTAVLPLLDDGPGRRLLDADEARGKGYLKLAEWLELAQTTWAAIRKEKAAKANALAWLNYRNKLTEQSPKAKFVVLYTRSATNLCAAAFEAAQTRFPKSEARLINGEIASRHFVVADSTYYFETHDPKEAGYLAALLNSPIVDDLIKPMQARGLWGPRDIHKKVWEIPIPRFNRRDTAHLRLAEIAAACAEKVKGIAPGFKDSFNGLRGPRVIGRVRASVRKALHGELAEIDAIVAGVLN